ncbi:MAG: DUF4157 domain-containing protein [Caldilineaceae bacterium]
MSDLPKRQVELPPGTPRFLQRQMGNAGIQAPTAITLGNVGTGLTINQPGDEYEQEAERVAEQVTNISLLPYSAPSLSDKMAFRTLDAGVLHRWHKKDHQTITEIAGERALVDPAFTQDVANCSAALDFTSKRIFVTGPRFLLGIDKGEGPEHGEDGNYSSCNEELARAQNLIMQNHFRNLAVQNHYEREELMTHDKKIDASFLTGATTSSDKKLDLVTKRRILFLGNACHIAQDRGSHGEGVKGKGHSDPRTETGWDPDNKADNHEGYDQAIDNTVQLFEDWKRLTTSQAKPLTLQRRSTDHSYPTEAPTIVIDVLRSPGKPLDPTTRTYMETRFGHDFSQVRVHTDSRAAESAEAVNALAYTVGRDVVFGTGQYQPETGEGKRLMAHELAHVVQQTGGQQNRTALAVNLPNSEAWQDTYSTPNTALNVQKSIVPEVDGRIQAVTCLLQRVVGKTSLDRPTPEETSIDITGRYEVTENQYRERITLQINQAGHHFEGWWQEHVVPRREGLSEIILMSRLTGELRVDHYGQVSFYYERTPRQGSERTIRGTLSAHQQGDGLILTIFEERHTLEFIRYSVTPRLSEQAIARAEAREVVYAAETAPLDEAEEALLRLIAEDIQSKIKRYYSIANQNVARDAAARDLSRFLGTRMSIFAAVQQPLAVRRLRGLLTEANLDLTIGTQSMTLWDALQNIASAHPYYTCEIQEELGGFPARASGKETVNHMYRWRTAVGGLSGNVVIVGAGGFLGKVIIEKLSPDHWIEEYFTIFGQLSAGPSVGIQVGQLTVWSNFESNVPWTSGNFRGRYSVLSGNVGFAGATGLAGSVGTVIFYGDEVHPPLYGDAGGLSVLIGVYYGAEGGATEGYLWGGQEEAIRAASRQRQIYPKSIYRSETSVHFAVNDPSLTDHGRYAIREMCALHLAAFESSSSVLRIDGYASTTGPEVRNEELARLRAENTLQAIKDVLGKHLPMFLRTQVEGHGARAAVAAGEPLGKENVRWRRVDVTLNGQLILTLH